MAGSRWIAGCIAYSGLFVGTIAADATSLPPIDLEPGNTAVSNSTVPPGVALCQHGDTTLGVTPKLYYAREVQSEVPRVQETGGVARRRGASRRPRGGRQQGAPPRGTGEHDPSLAWPRRSQNHDAVSERERRRPPPDGEDRAEPRGRELTEGLIARSWPIWAGVYLGGGMVA